MFRLQVHQLSGQLKNARLKIWLGGLLIASLALLFAARQNFPAQAAKPDLPEHVATIAYYSMKGNWDATLTLNNAAGEAVSAAVVLYSLEGKALPLPELSVQPHDSIAIHLREFIEGASNKGQFLEGSLAVHFNSLDAMAIAPQLTITEATHRLSYDLEPPMHFKSSRLEGLWWSLDDKSDAQVMLCNTTNQSVDAIVNIEWQQAVLPALITSLSAHQTLVLEIEKLLKDVRVESQGIGKGGISITHSGAPGALIA